MIKRSEVAPHKILNITAADIAGAERNCPTRCMLKRAIARQFPGAEYVMVDRRKLAWSVNDARFIYAQETKGSDKIKTFDDGGVVKPFKLELRIGIIRPRGWQAQRSSSASRKGKKYGRSEPVPRRYVMTRTRVDGYTTLARRKGKHVKKLARTA